MSELVEFYERASDGFGRRLAQVTDAQWDLPTPCTEWSVRDLVAHVLDEQLWIPPLVAGQTIAQVGDRFAGDQIGADALGSWTRARSDVLDSLSADGAEQRTVSLSFGETTASDYVMQVGADTLVHTWDLARAIGGDERLEPQDIPAAFEVLTALVTRFRSSGVFGTEIPTSAGDDAQTRLLALVGRTA